MRIWLASLLALLVGCAAVPWQPSADGWQELAPGLRYVQPTPGVYVLTVDLRRRRLLLTPWAERGRALTDFSAAPSALAVVNASFFDKEFHARGQTVSQGETWPDPLQPEASPLFACDAAQRCRLQLQPPYELPAATQLAVAGTPWLVRQGHARTADDDKACGSLCVTAHPRTALGLSADRSTVILLLVEGRRSDRPGMTLAEAAHRLQALGAQDGINLDGGGSSSLLLKGRSVMQRPANEPALRRVANALLVD